MSPLILRRYRADRLLHEEFERLRERVIATVDERLRRCSVALDRSDLEAAYGQAWHGLHAAVLEGQSIASPAGWLIVAAHRRALDEHRARKGAVPITFSDGTASGACRDLADELDDRTRLRALLEALRARLSEREQQAAALCYLQGLSRAEAAVRMGISESRMRKLMDGAGSGLRGVAGKVGEFVRVIAGGEWCAEQGSLMRGLAFGILDPRGDRHRLALDHSNACPACRAYVLSLRGLAAALPPLPALLRPIFTGPAAAAAGGVTTGAGGAPAASAGTALGGAALPASGAAGAGAAGGGWWLAGPLGAKLVAGCMLALGVGAGCVALDGPSSAVSRGARHAHRAPHVAAARRSGASEAPASSARASAGVSRPLAGSVANAAAIAGSARATREFGPERSGARATGGPPVAGAAPTARAAATASTSSRRDSSSATTAAPARVSTTEAASVPAAAQREFSPG
jgi:RNA polymerase sigma factor (sigma-70 family)